jgi:hypothetical protein
MAARQSDAAAGFGRGKKLSEHPELIETLWLTKLGVPFDHAITLDTETRLAYGVILARFEGRQFDWQRMQFKEK